MGADWPLMKESFAGDLYEEPLIMVPYPSPTNADARNLQPFFERISTAIRAVDEQARLCVRLSVNESD